MKNRGERTMISIRKAITLFLLLALGLEAPVVAGETEPPFPAWVFTHVVWEDESTTQGVYDLVRGYQEHGIPVGGVIIDSPWETAYNTFEVDTERYPRFSQLIADLHAQDIKVILWITSMINLEDPDYQLCLERGYFVKGREKTKWWKGVGGMLDYDNPEALAWWHQRMNKIIDLGIDAWKCDGTDPFMLYNGWGARKRYSAAYYSDFYHYTRERSGRQTLIMARPLEQILNESVLGLPVWSNPLGLGLYLQFAPVEISFLSWVGDQDPTFDGLKLATRWMLSSARKKYLILGSDIGGYRDGGPEKEVLIRWAQLGAFMPFMENGGCGEHRPWLFDPQTLDLYRSYVFLHLALGQYLWDHALRAWRDGRSLVTPLKRGRDHYLLGPDLLIAPVQNASGKVHVILPPGQDWVPLFKEVADAPEAQKCRTPRDAGVVLRGGCSFPHVYSLAAYPVFVRAGSENPFHFPGRAFPGLEGQIVEAFFSGDE
jgi:alpha-glucosidase (family GH31 glycosyl hydrolase)